jgi:hypothetical protein
MKRQLLLLLLALLSVGGAYAQYTNVSDLPTIYIETFDGTSITSKTVYKYCRLHYVDEQGQVTSYDSVSIRGRGNSTWNMSKKPYKIKFNTKEKFLGTGYAKAKKWTLMANAADKTLMRNAVTSAMGAFTSLKFNPAAKFVDLLLNGQYMGNYQISDQVDVRPHRVNITEQNYPLQADDNITGGYLLEVDGFREGNCFVTPLCSAPVRIHYPDDEEIVASQTSYIRSHVNKFEQVLMSDNFTDAEQGYRAYVDTVSLLDWYICTEVSANIDGFYSTYFYKEQDNPLLFWGPLWDYDIAYNNDYRIRSEKSLTSTVNSLMVDVAYSGSREWVCRMWEDPWFQRAVSARYQQLLSRGLVSYMLQKVDSLASLLSESQALNYQKWGINRQVYHEMVLYSSYQQYVEDLKTFITDHCDYLATAFDSRKPEDPTPPFEPQDCYYRIVSARTGKPIDVWNQQIVQMTDDPSRLSQDWQFMPVGSCFMIVNRATGQALNDPTAPPVGPTTNVGTQLNVAAADEHDQRQLWSLVPQGTEGCYNLQNTYTQHVANLSGGGAADYTTVLSYTSDSRNGSSQNRLWRMVPSDNLPTDGIAAARHTEPQDYALAYNPQTRQLHFGAAQPAQLTFTVYVHSASGQLAGTFRASESFSMTPMPPGLYVVSWTVDGKKRSVKFRR